MFSKGWETVYKKKKQINNWPWSELISYYYRYIKQKNIKNLKVLEIGSGTGPNSEFFIKNKIPYKSIEGSKSAVEIQKKKFPKYRKNFICADFTKSLIFKDKFDLIFDRGSITHNSEKATKQTIELVKNSLKKNGYFFGIDWFSTAHSNFKRGKITTDNHTKEFKIGDLKEIGNVQFFNKTQLNKIFKSFRVIEITEKKYLYHKNKTKKIVAFWIIVAQKK